MNELKEALQCLFSNHSINLERNAKESHEYYPILAILSQKINYRIVSRLDP